MNTVMVSKQLLKQFRHYLYFYHSANRPLVRGFCSSNKSEANGIYKQTEEGFHPKNVILLKKLTRYEYEKSWASESEDSLKHYLTEKGSDYSTLLQRHDEYQRAVDKIHGSLVGHGLSVEVLHRPDYGCENIQKADAVFTAGGDGTFLMAASKVKGHGIPIIGINTDPFRSEGVLCLPKTQSSNFPESLEKILKGRFKWMWRPRIRITMFGDHCNQEPENLHDEGLKYPERRFCEHVKEAEMFSPQPPQENEPPQRILPTLALNDVFVGESLSARVSFYELSVSGGPSVKQKSSGITVCTGTGSTSWYFNINHVPIQSVKSILELGKHIAGVGNLHCDESVVQKITREFNQSLVFDPTDVRMAYSVRDPVPHGIFQVTNARGFCDSLKIKSRMWDARVVVDGGLTFRFNDGAHLAMSMHDEDSLRCLKLF